MTNTLVTTLRFGLTHPPLYGIERNKRTKNNKPYKILDNLVDLILSLRVRKQNTKINENKNSIKITLSREELNILSSPYPTTISAMSFLRSKDIIPPANTAPKSCDNIVTSAFLPEI